MNISGIGNIGYAVQQSSYAQRSSGNEGEGASKATTQTGDSHQTVQSEKKSTEEQKVQQEIQRLKAQEEKVKAHEAAHMAAGGQYASGASYSYRPGPDGRSYIVGGEVQIDMSPGRTPQETIAKMQIVQRAAMAPGDPSSQDRAVAAQAATQAAEAQQEQLKQNTAEQTGSSTENSSASSGAGNPPETAANGTSKDAKKDIAIDTPTAENTGAKPGEAQAIATDGKDRNTRQIGAYQANTTPGDIFSAQNMSTYA